MEKKCPCGITIYVPKHLEKRKKYCSKKCFYKYRKVPIWNKGLKGIHLSPDSEFKKGQHPSPRTEFKKGHKPVTPFKKGERVSPNTEFKKGQRPWNAGKEYREILWEKHPQFVDGHTKYRNHAIRNGFEPICSHCQKSYAWGSLHVHHVDHNRRNNSLSNLTVLCHRCHANHHKNWEKRKKSA